jgi:hypothetical protein
MKGTPDSIEKARVVGYLGRDEVLYCSPACAASRGQANAQPVDEEEVQAIIDRGSLRPTVVCPVCGSDYPIDWADDRG